MSAASAAIKRLVQRSKLPAGDRVLTLRCACGHTDWVWNDESVRNVKNACRYCGKIRDGT